MIFRKPATVMLSLSKKFYFSSVTENKTSNPKPAYILPLTLLLSSDLFPFGKNRSSSTTVSFCRFHCLPSMPHEKFARKGDLAI